MGVVEGLRAEVSEASHPNVACLCSSIVATYLYTHMFNRSLCLLLFYLQSSRDTCNGIFLTP